MRENTLCNKCGGLLQTKGTPQTGKYKVCEHCKEIKHGKET
jgi:tRNA(Ile2) C34 agmatinyltransferase TiaS